MQLNITPDRVLDADVGPVQHDICQKPASQGLDLTAQDVIDALREQQFYACFQPRISLHDGRLSGVETLIRWQHPKHGVLLPRQFLDVVERTSNLSAITLLMIDLSLRQCKQWHAWGLLISISINLPARLLTDSTLADAIRNRVDAIGIAPHFLILEIAEPALMMDSDITLEMLTRLRLKGFGLSVDNYRMGSSSMMRLSQMPCSELKVDRAFVKAASEHAHLRTLLENAMVIARRLRFKVVATGLETHKDWVLLRELGCDEAQGDFIARPMPGDALVLWWSVNRRRMCMLLKREGFFRRVFNWI